MADPLNWQAGDGRNGEAPGEADPGRDDQPARE